MIVENNLSYEEYVEVMSTTGWTMPSERLVKEGLKNSINVKYVIDNETAGMARLITDHGYISLLADVIVKPKYQSKGVGTKLIEALINIVKSSLEDDEKFMIQLLAADGKKSFYEKFGFKDKKEVVEAGMYMWIKK